MPWLPQWLPAHLDEHLGWLIVLAAAIGLAVCLIGAGLLIRRRAGDAYRPRRAPAAVAASPARPLHPPFPGLPVPSPPLPPRHPPRLPPLPLTSPPPHPCLS